MFEQKQSYLHHAFYYFSVSLEKSNLKVGQSLAKVFFVFCPDTSWSQALQAEESVSEEVSKDNLRIEFPVTKAALDLNTLQGVPQFEKMKTLSEHVSRL